MYLIKRFFQGFATLVLVATITFFAYQLMPGDVVESLMGSPKFNTWSDKEFYRQSCQKKATELNLDLPIFYFVVSKYALDKRYFETTFHDDKNFLNKRLSDGYDLNNAFLLLDYEKKYQQYFFQLQTKLIDSSLVKKEVFETLQKEFDSISDAVVTALPFSKDFIAQDKSQLAEYEKTVVSFDRIDYPAPTEKYFAWTPHFSWNGSNCQFHQWIKKIAVLDFGTSYYSHRPVFAEIKDAIRWTLLLNGVSLFFIFAIGIFLGLKAARQVGNSFDKKMMNFASIIEAIPAFWIATMMLIFLTNNYYHCKIFPSAGLGDLPSDASFFKKILIASPHFIAPIICSVIVSFPLIFRQMRSNSIDIFKKDYIKTAKAKGLSQKSILYKHVLRNAIFPMITLFGMSIPTVIAGSVLIENTFNIPGMGKLMLSAVNQHDFPVLTALVLLVSVFTILGSTLADILYKLFNPQVK